MKIDLSAYMHIVGHIVYDVRLRPHKYTGLSNVKMNDFAFRTMTDCYMY